MTESAVSPASRITSVFVISISLLAVSPVATKPKVLGLKVTFTVASEGAPLKTMDVV